MGTSSGRFTYAKTNIMTNRENVIDLTESFTLVDHNHMNSVVINLDTDDSIREENTERPRPRRVRKRRNSRTRAVTINPETPILDLCTPEGKNKTKETKKSDQDAILNEPEDKRAKQSLGSCPICFDDFSGQELVSTKCGHIFCLVCLKKALRSRSDPQGSRCPTCRTVLRGRSSYHPIFL